MSLHYGGSFYVSGITGKALTKGTFKFDHTYDNRKENTFAQVFMCCKEICPRNYFFFFNQGFKMAR